MTITLTPEQQAWIDAHVAQGAYASVEDAARSLIDAAILDLKMLEGDDLAWAKPLVDEALAASRRGDVLTVDEHRARNRARLAAMANLVVNFVADRDVDEISRRSKVRAGDRQQRLSNATSTRSIADCWRFRRAGRPGQSSEQASV